MPTFNELSNKILLSPSYTFDDAPVRKSFLPAKGIAVRELTEARATTLQDTVTESVVTSSVVPDLVTTDSVHSIPTKDVIPQTTIVERPVFNASLVEDLYTKEPHFMTAYFESADLGSREMRIINVIKRDTLGWGRNWCEISLTTLSLRTKIPKHHLSAAVQALEKSGLLLKQVQPKGAKGKGVNLYGFSMHFFLPYMSKEEARKYIESGSVVTDPVVTESVTTCLVTTNQVVTRQVVTDLGREQSIKENPNYFKKLDLHSGSAAKIEQDSSLLTELVVIDDNLAKSQFDSNVRGLSKFLSPAHLVDLETRWLSFLKAEREKEESGLLRLICEKPEESDLIYEAFQIVIREQEQQGKIISPISVLQTNYTTQYRTKAVLSIQKQKKADKNQKVTSELKQQEDDLKSHKERTSLIRVWCFEQAFPDLNTRREYIRNATKGDPILSRLKEDSPIAAAHAVAEWAKHEGQSIFLNAMQQTKGLDLSDIRLFFESQKNCTDQ